MITVTVKNCNSISQKIYNSIIHHLPFHQLHCSCGHAACLTIHGYYSQIRLVDQLQIVMALEAGEDPFDICSSNPLYDVVDSRLTPSWLYKEMLIQLGFVPKFYRSEAKRQLQKEIEIIRCVQGQKIICVLDEAHLLERETIEEFRFLLNYRFDSMSPVALILVGQTELWEEKLRLKRYAAVRQRIDINCVLPPLDRSETEKYIQSHLVYAGCNQELFTTRAIDEIQKISSGIPRIINRVCEKALMYAYQQRHRLIDDHVIDYVTDHEMLKGVAMDG